MNDIGSSALLLALAAVCLASAIAMPCSAEDLSLACTVDYRAPVPPSLLKKAGIRHVYVYLGMPLKADPATGRRVLDEKLRPQLDEFFKLCAENGIRVLLVSGFYTRPPKGAECIDASGRTIAMGCFNNPAFLAAMSGEIEDLAKTFGAYEAFAGFCFDDGVQVRADCCACDVCKKLFKEQCGLEPPAFEPDRGGPRLDPKEPRLLWDAFQREAYAAYLRTQAKAAGAVSDRLLLTTIPSDSYFYGRHLSLEVARDKTSLGSDARLQRIDRIQVEDWRIFQSFPFPAVVADGAGERRFGTGCHLTTPSPKIILHTEGPFIESAGRQQFLSPAEIGRMIRTTLAEGGDRICFWNNARAIAGYPDGFDAIGEAAAEMGKVRGVLQERRAFPARVGLLYSTATEIVQQPWGENTLERWRHLHAFEAMAYALTRRSAQFRIVLDSRLDAATLSTLDVIILTGVTHLTKPVAELLEKGVAEDKLMVLADPSCLAIKGAKVCPFDQDSWFNRQLKGYRQVRCLDHQASEIWTTVLPELRLPELQPATVSGESCLAKIFQGKDGSLLMFLVNWDLENESTAQVSFREARRITDESSGQTIGEGKTLDLKIAPADWRVIRCAEM